MAEHTPGPWELEIDTVFIREGVKVQPTLYHLDTQGMADARLISKSPEMFAILTELVESPNAKQNELWDRAREVVKDVKGGA